MSDAVAASSRDAGTQAVGSAEVMQDEPCIRYDREFDPGNRKSYTFLLIILGFGLVQTGGTYLQGWWLGGYMPVGDILVCLGYWFVWAVLPTLVYRSINRSQVQKLRGEAESLRSQLASTPPADETEHRQLAVALAQVKRRMTRHSHERGAGTEYLAHCRAHNMPVPRTFVHGSEELEQSLRRIPLIEDMLEAEFVDTERSQPSQRLWLAIILGMLALLVVFGGVGLWIPAIFAVLVGLTIVFRHCEFSRSAPFLRFSTRRWVAAPGCVQLWLSRETDASATPAAWQVGESIMEVELDWGKRVQVQFYGVRRSPRLSFASVKSPVFVTLWQRWNHPHPRPELLLDDCHNLDQER